MPVLRGLSVALQSRLPRRLVAATEVARRQPVDFKGQHAIANPVSPVRLRVAPPTNIIKINDIGF